MNLMSKLLLSNIYLLGLMMNFYKHKNMELIDCHHLLNFKNRILRGRCNNIVIGLVYIVSFFIPVSIFAFTSPSENTSALASFTFDCSTPTITGSFYASGVAQAGYVTLKITNVTAGATSINITNADGFSGGIKSITLSASLTSIQIPVSFTGKSAAGTYTLVLSSPNATNSCNVSITVFNCDKYKPVISTNVPSMLCTGDSIILMASTGTRYLWSTGESTSSVLKKAAGAYSVTVTSNGCTASTSQTVTYNNNCEAGLCTGILANDSYNVTFGIGSRTSLPLAVSGATTTHIYSPFSVIVDGQYAVANNASEAGAWAISVPDHSGDGALGRLMVINADNTPKECFRLPVSGLCGNLKYQFSAWIRSISNKPEKPNVTLEIRDAVTDSVLAIKGTGDIVFGSWIQYGLTFNTPNNPNLYVVLRNNTRGGLNGNDLVIDDIQFAYCGPPTILTAQGGVFDASLSTVTTCENKNITLNANVTTGFLKIPEYQWQESVDNGATWTNISGATSISYSFVSSASLNDKKFKLLVAEKGKITNPGCRVESNIITYKYLNPSGTITAFPSPNVCSGDSLTLTAMSGNKYVWSTGETTQSITKKTAGTYSVTVTDASGCVSSASQTVVVNTRPIASIAIEGEANISTGGAATLTATGGTSYIWNNGATTAAISITKVGTYIVTVTGANGCTSTSIRTIGVNNLPVATNSNFEVTANTVLNGDVSKTVTDIDANLNLGSFIVTQGPITGTINMNADGSFVYTPKENFVGKDSVIFKVCDYGGLCVNATIVFNVVAPLNPPTIRISTTLSVPEDSLISINILPFIHDFDKTLNPSDVVVTEAPLKGTFKIGSDGVSTYVPNPNYNGFDSLKYKICNPLGACLIGTLVLNVEPVNDFPVLVNSTPSVQEDNVLNGNVSPNASDIDMNLDINSFATIDTPRNGTIKMTPSGSYIYTPKPNFNGVDSVHFKVCDLGNACDTATLIFTVHAVNDAPALKNENIAATEDIVFNGNVSTNASDVDGNLNLMSFTLVSNPNQGTLVMNANGSYSYTPKPNFNGADSAYYQVCDLAGACITAKIIIAVMAVNDNPTLTNASAAVQEDTPFSGNLVPNASDVDGNLNPNGFAATDSPKNGTITINPNGTFTYTPKPNFSGIDSVHYKVCDAANSCVTATLFLNVLPVNDAPTTSPTSVDLSEDVPSFGSVLLDVIDVDGNLNLNSFALVDIPTNGTITMNQNGSFGYTPKLNFNGKDSVHYKVCDMSGACTVGTILFNIAPVNDAPTLLVANVALDEDLPFTTNIAPNASDIDGNLNPNSFSILNMPLHGTIALSPTGVLTYTPVLDYVGQDSVLYKVCDTKGLCTTSTIVLNISSVNDAPILTNATPSVSEDTELTGDVAPNASDVDGNLDPRSFTILDSPANGTITMGKNGKYSYKPLTNFNGIDSVHYQVCDSLGACSKATIIFNVKPVNDTPTVSNVVLSTLEDKVLNSSALSNAFDIDGNLNPNGFTLVDTFKNGVGTMLPNGSFTYTPKLDFTGLDSAYYQICDSNGLCVKAKIIITVEAINDAPIVTSATPTLNEDASLNGSLTPNVKDTDGNLNPNSFVLLDNVLHGTITLFGNGNYIYKPDPNFNGADSVHFQVCDSTGACSVATIIFEVKPLNDKPDAVISAPIVNEDTPANFCGIINDPDKIDEFTVSLCNTPRGFITPQITNNQLCIDYVPEPEFNGVDSLCLVVCDKEGLCDTVKLAVFVNPVNDAPALTVASIFIPADSTTQQCFPITDNDPNEIFSVKLCDNPKGTADVKIENSEVCVTYKTTDPNFVYDDICLVVCDKSGTCTQVYIPVYIALCEDKAPPVINCPANIEVSTTGQILSDSSKFILQSAISDSCKGIVLNFNLPSATDECGVPKVSQIQGLTSGKAFNIGTSNLTFEATDKNGKKSSCKISVKVTPVSLLAVDTLKSCVGETVTLQANAINNATYTWRGPQNASFNTSEVTLPISTIKQEGRYAVAATFGNNCTLKDTLYLVVNSVPKLGNDTVELDIDNILIYNVLKNDTLISGSTPLLKVVQNAQNGVLTLKNDGFFNYEPSKGFKGIDKFNYEICSNSCPNACPKATVIINVSDLKKIYATSEIITPNGDGANDFLVVQGFDVTSPTNKSSIVVYNQWGDAVYNASPYKNDWDGTYKNAPVPEGTYYVVFRASPNSEPLRTYVTILR